MPRRLALFIAATFFAVMFTVRPSAVAQPDTGSLPAFPGAEGFGAAATGGRGGKVYLVTTLEPHGAGSFGDALDPATCEPRTVVFRVSGVIRGPDPMENHSFDLTCGNLTVAGQTAPGAGITIHSRVIVADGSGGNIIMRHLRFRAPDAVAGKLNINDPLQVANSPRLIFDHISASWGGDETIDLYEGANDVTVQWSTIEASRAGAHPDGPNHNYGMLSGPDTRRVSVHHVLFAHHRARCPAMGGGPSELVNSVVYDCQDGFVHHNPADGEFQIVGNTFLRGPNHTEWTPLYFDDEEPGGTRYYLSRNDLNGTVYDDIRGTPFEEAAFAGASTDAIISTPSVDGRDRGGYVPVSVQSPQDAYVAVLERAGAFPRDRYTRQTIDEVRNRSGAWGMDDPESREEMLEGLRPAKAPADADDDGMADEWERGNGLDAADGTDHSRRMPSGYTAIEEYVNGLADSLVSATLAGSAVSPVTAASSPSTVDAAAPVPTTAVVVSTTGSDAASASTAEAPASSSTATASAPGADNTSAEALTARDPVVVTRESSTLEILALVVAIAALVAAAIAVTTARQARSRP